MELLNRVNGEWMFFSNNTHVLVCILGNPRMTMREMAIRIGITERAVQRIVTRLIESEVLTVEKDGLRNQYTIDLSQQLRHPLESHRTIGEFLKLIGTEGLDNE